MASSHIGAERDILSSHTHSVNGTSVNRAIDRANDRL